jgi:hypothetical protein
METNQTHFEVTKKNNTTHLVQPLYPLQKKLKHSASRFSPQEEMNTRVYFIPLTLTIPSFM